MNTVAESNNDYTIPDVIDIPDLARGIYFLRVQPHAYGSWSGADYKVKARVSVFPPVVSDDIGDEKQYALPIVNQLSTLCTLSGNSDVDYFECQIPHNANVTLSITDIEPGGNVDMEVYTAWDVMIDSAAQTGNANELIYLQDLVPGQYFIRISGKGATPYTFTATQEFAEATGYIPLTEAQAQAELRKIE